MKVTIGEFEEKDVAVILAATEAEDDYQDHDMSPIWDLEYDC